MFRLTRTRYLPIGLDLGRNSIRALQLRVEGEEVAVVAAASQPVPEEVRGDFDARIAASASIVDSMLRAGTFHGRDVVTCLPREIVQYRNIRLPLMPSSELDAAVEFEARTAMSDPTSELVIRHVPAGEVRTANESRQEVILVGSPRRDVDTHIERLLRAGLNPVSADVELCALYRGVERFIRRREDEQEVHVIVEVGTRLTNVIIGRGRSIGFFKTVAVGGQQITNAVAARLEIGEAEAESLRIRMTEDAASAEETGRRDPVRQAVQDAIRPVADDLAREIGLCLRYYSVTFRGSRAARVRLAGGESADPALRSLLASHLSIPVEPLRPMQSVDASGLPARERMNGAGQWALAFGLALKQAHGPFGARDGTPRDSSAAGFRSTLPEPMSPPMSLAARMVEPLTGGASHA